MRKPKKKQKTMEHEGNGDTNCDGRLEGIHEGYVKEQEDLKSEIVLRPSKQQNFKNLPEY